MENREQIKTEEEDKLEEIITSREPIRTKRLETKFNEVLLVDLKDDGSIIFKPYDGEDSELKEYIQYKRERATYLFDKIFNWGLVPPTVIRDIDGRVGSAQVFVEDAQMPTDISSEELGDIFHKDRSKLYAFDFLIGNNDRNPGNYLIKVGRIIAIDNGLAFQALTEDEYPDYEQFILENEIFLKNILADNRKINIFLELLTELVPRAEIDRFKKRLIMIAKTLSIDFSI